MREDSEGDLSDDDIINYRKKNIRKSNSPVPTDPVLLSQFCESNLTKILKQNTGLEDMATEIKVKIT